MAEADGPALAALRRTGDLLARLPRPVGVALAAGWMLLIWRLSSGVPPKTPVHFVWATVGNLVHAPLFGLLALWLALALPRGAPRRRWPALTAGATALVLAVVVAYGAVDEWHQSRVPGRDASERDLLVDLIGGACTLGVAAYLLRADATETGVRMRLGLAALLCVGGAMLAAL